MEELQLGAALGDGASGDVFASTFQGADSQSLGSQGSCTLGTCSIVLPTFHPVERH